MKTIKIIFTIVLFFGTLFLNAQIKVSTNGNVGIQHGTESPLSTLSIGGVGSTQSKVDIANYSPSIALNVYQSSPSTGINYGIKSTIQGGYSTNIGVKGECTILNPPIYVGKSYGVLGIAGNCAYGYNYGVYGTINGGNYGAGIVGTTYGTLDIGIPGTYAGYFAGNIAVTGTVNGVTISNSDIRYKKNIVELNAKQSLNNILKMNSIEYNLEQIYYETKEDSIKTKKGIYDEDSQVFQKKHYGLIAQDLQKIYPDLVYQNDSGYLSVNYTGLIPILIQSIKVLNDKVETLIAKTDGSSTSSKVKSSSDFTETELLTYPVLDQNIPNPFNTSTTIGYYLPTIISNATIYVYDMNGVQLKSYSINERGKGNIIIQGSELNAGMYLYALIADGKVIDTKRMILTK